MISRTPGRSAQARWTAVTAGGVVVLSFEGVIVRSLELDQWTILLLRGPLFALGLALIFRLGRGRGGLAAALGRRGGLALLAAGLGRRGGLGLLAAVLLG